MPERGGVPQLDVLLRDFDQRLRQLETHQHHEVPSLATLATSGRVRDYMIVETAFVNQTTGAVTLQTWTKFSDFTHGQEKRGFSGFSPPADRILIEEGFAVAVIELGIGSSPTPVADPYNVFVYHQPNGSGTGLGVPSGVDHVHQSLMGISQRKTFPFVGHVNGGGDGFGVWAVQSSGNTRTVFCRMEIAVWEP